MPEYCVVLLGGLVLHLTTSRGKLLATRDGGGSGGGTRQMTSALETAPALGHTPLAPESNNGDAAFAASAAAIGRLYLSRIEESGGSTASAATVAPAEPADARDAEAMDVEPSVTS